MTKDKALRMALNWLVSGNFVYPTALRTAIIEALSQPSDSVEQEPVAKYIGECNEGSLVQLYEEVIKGAAFYTVPPKREPDDFDSWYASPYAKVLMKSLEEDYQPKREWVGLTDDEIFKTHKQVDSMQYLTFGKAIEAKLKEKNHD